MIDLDIDELEKLCKYEIGRGTANPYTVNGNPIHAMLEIITRLRQAEKDAARYRELRDAESETCLEFINAKARMASPEWLDGMVDEYMKCK